MLSRPIVIGKEVAEASTTLRAVAVASTHLAGVQNELDAIHDFLEKRRLRGARRR